MISTVSYVRELALQILHRVETTDSYADRLVEEKLRESELDIRDRAFVTELVQGTLRWRGKIDYILTQTVNSGIDRLTPWIRNLLRLGVYQLYFLQKIPDFAVIDESVKLAYKYGHTGTAGLVNAVLRNLACNPDGITYPSSHAKPIEYVSVCYSHPEWIVNRWVNRYGLDHTIKLCKINNTPPALYVRTNTIKISTEELIERLANENVRTQPTKYCKECLVIETGGQITSLSSYKEGLFQVQDESMCLPVQLLAPQPGECIIDLCSAPGGKTTYIAQVMQNQGQIIAIDIHLQRLKLVVENCKRLGITNVFCCVSDGRYLSTTTLVDRMIIDAPCSGSGVYRRRADARWRRSEQELVQLSQLQRELLSHGAELVRKNGIIVYSTCSIEPEENEDVIEWFLENHSNFVKEDPSPFVHQDVITSNNEIVTLPSIHGIDGMYAVRLKKLP